MFMISKVNYFTIEERRLLKARHFVPLKSWFNGTLLPGHKVSQNQVFSPTLGVVFILRKGDNLPWLNTSHIIQLLLH